MHRPRPSRARLLVAATLGGVAFAAPVGAADLPVVASHLVTGPDSRVDLTNTSSQPATAWTLALTTREADGRVHQANETIDAYLAEVTREFAGMAAAVDRLMPGQTRQMTLDPVPAGTTAEVTAVVLDDGTASGDEEEIRAVFDRRAQERDELHEIVDVFDAVLPTLHGIEAMKALKERFDRSISGPESTTHRSAREAVDLYLQRTNAANVDAADRLLRNYADIVRREYALAERHSRRKR